MGLNVNVPNASPEELPPVDEGWWAAVLSQGENSTGGNGHYPFDDLIDDPSFDVISPDSSTRELRDDWSRAREMYEVDQTVRLPVVGYNRGGLIVSWGRLRGFVPVSHIVDCPAHLSDLERLRELARRVGKSMQLKVIEFDPGKGRVVLSERAAQAGPGSRKALLSNLKAGDVLEGAVTNVTDFGAFVDLGGVEGLLHVSEISWGRVAHPSDVLQAGQKLQVYVINVEPGKGRVGLSLKRLRPDPWATVEERYRVGQIVEGTITNIVPFGAFTCIEEGLEGLIHVSELAEGNFMHPANVVSEGQVVAARILSIDGRARRMALSLRRVIEDDWRSSGYTM